jgi:hypothetical protein
MRRTFLYAAAVFKAIVAIFNKHLSDKKPDLFSLRDER